MNIFKLPVHPAADVFPMLTKHELHELAEDIKVNGLINPVVIKHELVIGNGKPQTYLIDGRNRLAACKLAGVTHIPVKEMNGEDPESFIISSNLHRRNMNKGQKAMAVAKIYPEPKRGMHSELKKSTGNEFDKAYLSKARAVLRWTPAEADKVLDGGLVLNKAFDEAEKVRIDSQKDKKTLTRLQDEAPDLAELVVEERMTLSDGLAALENRIRDAKANRYMVETSIKNLLSEMKHWTYDHEATVSSMIGYKAELEKELACSIDEALELIQQFKASGALEHLLSSVKGN